jgi:hypothetical protein
MCHHSFEQWAGADRFCFWRQTMTPKLSSLLRSGLIALGIAAGISAPAFAVPIVAGLNPAVQPSPQADAGITLIQDGGRYWRRHRGDGDRWRSRRHWRDGDRWRDRRHSRRNWRRYDRGPSIYLDFSIPAYRYAPRYYAPRYYAPRRVYRGGGSAHVQWCYSRYRSYRAYDNTFQPYNGPRRQCWSPYS